jgi:hypothetical protein
MHSSFGHLAVLADHRESPKLRRDVEDLIDINDIPNGVFAEENMHHTFDLREVAVRHVCLLMFDSSRPH